MPAETDVLVLGGGTAGCVIAGRLAEAGRQVLLLEAGPDHGPLATGRWPDDLLDARALPPTHDWGYVGHGWGGQELRFERARVIGGCSAHNGCTQMVGWGPDFDRWARTAPGWSADELRPLFDAARERMRIRAWEPDEIQPLQREFVMAAAGMGLEVRDDLDDLGGGAGTGAAPVNVVDGLRWNASFGYLDPVRDGGLLTVVGDRPVDRIVVRGDRAVGVELHRDDPGSFIRGEHVVVCAGAYGSPEVLLRSGIGPATALRASSVDVVVDLPGVGANLHDHPAVRLEFEGTQELARDLAAFSRGRWLPEEQTTAKLTSSATSAPYDLHVYPWVEPNAASDAGWKVVLPVGLVEPRSRGRVMLTGPEPHARGDIDHGYLQEEADVTALADGLRWVQELTGGSPSLARYLGRATVMPRAEDDLTTWIRRHHEHYWHPAGSCRMGSADDPMAVVDGSGSVYGLTGLTIADASVFPQVPRSTPAWPVVVAGERIARSMIESGR